MWQYELQSEDKEPRVIDGCPVGYPLSIERAEEENTVLIDGERVPFGYCNAQWKQLLSDFEPGDELWFTTSPEEDWEAGRGVEGIILVRKNKVVGGVTTSFN